MRPIPTASAIADPDMPEKIRLAIVRAEKHEVAVRGAHARKHALDCRVGQEL
jgi:hypothetical protein